MICAHPHCTFGAGAQEVTLVGSQAVLLIEVSDRGMIRVVRKHEARYSHRIAIGDPDGSVGGFGITEAADGAIWISYRNAVGVSRLMFSNDPDHPAITHFNQQNGLGSDQSYFLGASPKGAVWVGTDHGIDIFEQGSWRHVGRADGMIWEDTDTNAFWAEADGDIWLGTSRGLSHFHPPQSSRAEQPPTVMLTSVRFGQDNQIAHA